MNMQTEKGFSRKDAKLGFQSDFSSALSSSGDLDMSAIVSFILNRVDRSVPA